MKILFGLIAFLVLILLGIGVLYLASSQTPEEGKFLRHDFVRGSAAVHDALPYTLNFAQQEILLTLLNESKQVSLPHVRKKSPENISEVIFYLFDDQNDRKITPLKEDFSLFSVSTWPKNTYLRIKRPQELKTLLETTYDT